jgi:hypothetical protein
MWKRSALAALVLASVIAATPSLRAQTCGGTLSCTTSPAYTYKSSAAGAVLFGDSTNGGTSAAIGVEGQESNGATGSAGVSGFDGLPCTPSSLSLGAAGVIGGSLGATGVIGYTNSQRNGQAGVAGYNYDGGFVCGSSAVAAGYLGYMTGSSSYGVYSAGNIAATGTKSFLEPHPTDASKEIRYVSLEGPEAGTYFRGSGHTVNGTATIEVPDSFRLVTAEAGLTVVVTPVGELAQVAAISKSLDKIVVQSSKDVAFDYMVNGVRKAFQDFQAIAPNDDFVPTGPTDHRFFALPAESQRRLVATGIYLPDGSVNLAKAHEMGWDRNWEPAQEANGSAAGFLRFAGSERATGH